MRSSENRSHGGTTSLPAYTLSKEATLKIGGAWNLELAIEDIQELERWCAVVIANLRLSRHHRATGFKCSANELAFLKKRQQKIATLSAKLLDLIIEDIACPASHGLTSKLRAAECGRLSDQSPDACSGENLRLLRLGSATADDVLRSGVQFLSRLTTIAEMPAADAAPPTALQHLLRRRSHTTPSRQMGRPTATDAWDFLIDQTLIRRARNFYQPGHGQNIKGQTTVLT